MLVFAEPTPSPAALLLGQSVADIASELQVNKDFPVFNCLEAIANTFVLQVLLPIYDVVFSWLTNRGGLQ